MLHFDNREQAVVILVGLLLVLTLVEMWLSYREDRKYYEKRDTLTNVYLTSLAFIINLSVKAATFFILDFAWHNRFFEIKNAWLYWIVLIIVQDFLYWVLHYVGHYSRVFWAMHVTHHSSEHFNLPATGLHGL
jgi:sterol desaturase/sphingolipid hydroxylase (fatty acid hydroxylase superfamily)